MERNTPAALQGIVLGGIVAASIDIVAACLINGRGVGHILHSIAGGLLAKDAFAGGTPTAILGLFLQELMGLIIAAIYSLAARRIAMLRDRWIAFGLIYGVVIYVVMNYVVLPLSAWHIVPPFEWRPFVANLSAMLLFGLIVAYFARRRAPLSAADPVPEGRKFAS